MITQRFLTEHFKKHNTLTLYKPDGTPVVFTKQYNLVMTGGYHKFTFRDFDALADFYKKQRLSNKPVIEIV